MSSDCIFDSENSPDTPAIPGPANALEFIWRKLKHSIAAPEGGWRDGVLCSTGAHGAEGRTVVLRNLCEAEGFLDFYTDSRSPKTAQIAGDSRVAWVFYDPGERAQLRVRGRALVLGSEETLALEAQISAHAKSNYSTKLPPGTPIGEGAESEESGTLHFAAVRVFIEQMDLLILRREGHLRFQLQQQEDKKWRTAAVVP